MQETTKNNVSEQLKDNDKNLSPKGYEWEYDRAITSILFDIKTPNEWKSVCFDTTNLLLKHADFTLKEKQCFLANFRKQREFWKNIILQGFAKRNYDSSKAELYADLLSSIYFFNPKDALKEVKEELSRNENGEPDKFVEADKVLLTATEIVDFYVESILDYLVQVGNFDVEFLYKISLDMAEEKYLQDCLIEYREKHNNGVPFNVTTSEDDDFKKKRGTYDWFDSDKYLAKWRDISDYSKNFKISLTKYWWQDLRFCGYWREMWDFYEADKKGVWLAYTKFLVDGLQKCGAEFEKAFATVDEIIKWWQSDKRLDYKGLTAPVNSRLPMLCHWYLSPDEEEYIYNCVKKYRLEYREYIIRLILEKDNGL